MRASCESVSAITARCGVDREAQVAQPIDVAANCPLGNVQTLCEFGPTPQPVGLQQREELQRPPSRIVSHLMSFSQIADIICPQ